jgi:hypothetical protein
MTDLSIDLMAPEGRSAFNDALASLIRSDRHGEADAILARHFAALPSEFSALARALPADAVSITGWEAFNTRIEVVSLRGKPVTAVGIDISDQGDATDAEGRREQLLESSYYTDESGFRFSGASRESLVAASGGAARRRGQAACRDRRKASPPRASRRSATRCSTGPSACGPT